MGCRAWVYDANTGHLDVTHVWLQLIGTVVNLIRRRWRYGPSFLMRQVSELLPPLLPPPLLPLLLLSLLLLSWWWWRGHTVSTAAAMIAGLAHELPLQPLPSRHPPPLRDQVEDENGAGNILGTMFQSIRREGGQTLSCGEALRQAVHLQ